MHHLPWLSVKVVLLAKQGHNSDSIGHDTMQVHAMHTLTRLHTPSRVHPRIKSPRREFEVWVGSVSTI